MKKSRQDFQREVFEAVRGRDYVDLPPIIIQSYISTVKLRFRIRKILESFIQFYYNEDNGKVSMALVVEGKRIYGHDYTPKGGWHRHVLPDGEHDHSEEGKKPVTVEEFLEKVDEVVRGFQTAR
jgi:hypothetical protein